MRIAAGVVVCDGTPFEGKYIPCPDATTVFHACVVGDGATEDGSVAVIGNATSTVLCSRVVRDGAAVESEGSD